ncbi:hypothetical protein Pla175_43270 [Pirellulimonas nuda]|uniref:BREX system ATP-binding protein BrxD n=1 Tax=Pirellulimonas nuda TaxID=2528009 RepID=A0A518DHG9_9BACT|nr:BREX system ATP-binding protein BrxD [Pirellulimonas nuda]QDU90914.1 hypothetical protein Pla175_43270 [Pirellulimonas nuda]
MMQLSKQRSRDILNALRRGTVPEESLDAFAVGLDRFEVALDEELRDAKQGQGQFKAVRGEYGCGKTFFARWLADRARKLGFATAEVQISETETPLHRMETVYRRLNERLRTAECCDGAFRNVIDNWFLALEQDVLSECSGEELPDRELFQRTNELFETRLRKLGDSAQVFSLALRGYRQAQAQSDRGTADAILAWLAGQPNVAAAAKRAAGVKGDIDHFGASASIKGLLTVLRDSGYAGLLLVLDEVETVQRMRSDVRQKCLNALRQLLDDVDGGQFPGLYLVVTGTSGFFTGPQGVRSLEPLAQRLHVEFDSDPQFDNPRMPQIRLAPFNLERLCEVGGRVRDIHCSLAGAAERVRSRCDDHYIRGLADAIAGQLGGKVGTAPRIFLKKLVDVLDRVDQYEAFDPGRDFAVKIDQSEMTTSERHAAAGSVDEVELEL